MEFRALQQIQSLQQGLQEGNFFEKSWHFIKRSFAKRANYKLIICGATQFTGQHAFVFKQSEVEAAQAMTVLNEGLELLANTLEKEGWSAGGILIKDLEKEGTPYLSSLNELAYSAFPFQPNMLLTFNPDWKTFR